MSFTYRMSTPEDTDQLVEFWNANSGWDIIDRREWEHRFYFTPLGQPAVSLAIDDKTKKIAGQFIFIPFEIVVNGESHKAFRPFAPVLDDRLRKFNFLTLLQHPIFHLYNQAVSLFRENDIALIQMLTDPRWARAFQFVPFFQVHFFPLWSKPLNGRNMELPDGMTIQPMDPTDLRIDELWQKASTLYNCQLVRDTRILPWKTSHGNYHLTGVFDNGELTGIFSSLLKGKDRQWVIGDIVTVDANESFSNCLKAAYIAVQNEHAALPVNDQANCKIALLAIPRAESVLTELGFIKESYKFPFVVHLLNNRISKQDINPEHWYVSAND